MAHVSGYLPMAGSEQIKGAIIDFPFLEMLKCWQNMRYPIATDRIIVCNEQLNKCLILNYHATIL